MNRIEKGKSLFHYFEQVSMVRAIVVFIASSAAVFGCQEPPAAESDLEGYKTSDCRQQQAQNLAQRYTQIMQQAFEQEPRAAAYNTLENVQRFVCMANGESTFGTDSSGSYSGAFQMAARTRDSFCKGLSMADPVQNARCALRIAFTGASGHGPQGWGAWPNTSRHCIAGTAIRRCFDETVKQKYVNNDCGTGATLSANESADEKLKFSASFNHKQCPATEFYVQLVNTHTQPFQESDFKGPFRLTANQSSGATGTGTMEASIASGYDVARFILRDANNKELWRSGQKAPSPKIMRNAALDP